MKQRSNWIVSLDASVKLSSPERLLSRWEEAERGGLCVLATRGILSYGAKSNFNLSNHTVSRKV